MLYNINEVIENRGSKEFIC